MPGPIRTNRDALPALPLFLFCLFFLLAFRGVGSFRLGVVRGFSRGLFRLDTGCFLVISMFAGSFFWFWGSRLFHHFSVIPTNKPQIKKLLFKIKTNFHSNIEDFLSLSLISGLPSKTNFFRRSFSFLPLKCMDTFFVMLIFGDLGLCFLSCFVSLPSGGGLLVFSLMFSSFSTGAC